MKIENLKEANKIKSQLDRLTNLLEKNGYGIIDKYSNFNWFAEDLNKDKLSRLETLLKEFEAEYKKEIETL